MCNPDLKFSVDCLKSQLLDSKSIDIPCKLCN